MASPLAGQLQALSATLLSSRAETTSPKPPRSSSSSKQRSHQRPGTAAAASSSRRRLATAVLASQLLPPVASSGAGTFDLRLTLPEKSSEEAEAVVRTHARNLLGVKRFIDAGAWRELQAALRASASNLKQDLYAIIQARPTGQRPELRRLYSDLFNSVTSVSSAIAPRCLISVAVAGSLAGGQWLNGGGMDVLAHPCVFCSS